MFICSLRSVSLSTSSIAFGMLFPSALVLLLSLFLSALLLCVCAASEKINNHYGSNEKAKIERRRRRFQSMTR